MEKVDKQVVPEVTIIMPLFNNQKYVSESIESVLNQTFTNFEIIVIDDCSSDNSVEIIEKLANKDRRIKLLSLDTNSGAAIARNRGLIESKGRFIAFLDADDLWKTNKLEEQLKFMKKNNYTFSCTSYDVIDSSGMSLNKEIYMKSELDYTGFLTNNLLQTVGIMIDSRFIQKSLIKMPNLRRRQDAATWLQILKAGHKCYGMKEVLASYRRVPGSLSSNKIKAVSGVWFLYRKVENLPLIYSSYIFTRYAILAIWKRMYFKK